MKKSILILALCIFIVISTMGLTITAKHNVNGKWDWWFNSFSIGNIHTEVTFKPNKGVQYTYHVFRYFNPDDPFGSQDPNYQCFIDSRITPPGNWSCSFDNAPIGYYISRFTVSKGTVTITQTIDFPYP